MKHKCRDRLYRYRLYRYRLYDWITIIALTCMTIIVGFGIGLILAWMIR